MAAYDPEKALSILNSLCSTDSDTDEVTTDAPKK
jgi:hypothetical protein